MMQYSQPPRVDDHGSGLPNDGSLSDRIDLEALFAAARRQALIVILAVSASCAVGVAYLVSAAPYFTATTTILIDSKKNQDQIIGSMIAEAAYDPGAIESQVEIIRSESVALAVVKALDLDKDPEFIGEATVAQQGIRFAMSLLNPRSWFGSDEVTHASEAEARQRRAAQELLQNMDVRRVGRSYVLALSYQSRNPSKAAQIANAYANAYFADQMNSRYEIIRRASGWLQDRIEELRSSSIRADLAIQRFKAEKGIISIAGNSGDSTTLMDQQLAEASTQLTVARGETAKAEARVKLIEDLLRSGSVDAAVTESLGNPVINDMRTKYLRASKTAAEFAARVGANHYQVLSLQNEMVQYERLIREELLRIGQTYKAELEIARDKEKSLGEAMTALIGSQAVSNDAMVQLRELQRESDSYKGLYQAFLQRYQDATHRESFPTMEARVITPASAPFLPSSPRPLRVMLVAGLLGLMIGGSIGWLRERHDRVFRVASQVRDELGLEVLGMVPEVDDLGPESLPEGPFAANHVRASSPLQNYAVVEPLTSFAETLRRTKVEVDLTVSRAATKRVGFVSVLPGEGKSTLSKNFASLVAFQGARTLLVDADLRNPGLTRAVAAHATVGLIEVLKGEVPLNHAILNEPMSGLDVLPAVVKRRVWHSAELLASKEMDALIAECEQQYDYIVFDLPPIGPVIDVRAAARQFDALVFVVEWGKTPRSLVETALRDDRMLYERCVGVVLNRVDGNKLKLYDHYGAKTYYYGKYSNYYLDAKQRRAESV